MGEEFFPAAHSVLGLLFGRFFFCAHNRVGQPRRNRLFGREPAAVAVVLGHQRLELLCGASRAGGIDFGQPAVGLAKQVEFAAQFRRIALGGADGGVDQVEGIGRNFAAALAGGLRDDGGGRGGVAVAAGRDAARELAQSVVDEQRVVDVAARRANVDH